MGEAKRRKLQQSGSDWPRSDSFRDIIDLHDLPPVAAINGARIRALTGDDRIPETAQVSLGVFRAVVGERTFHVGFCLGDGERFSAIGIGDRPLDDGGSGFPAIGIIRRFRPHAELGDGRQKQGVFRDQASIRAIGATIDVAFRGETREGDSGGGVIHGAISIRRRKASPFKRPKVNSPHPNLIWKGGGAVAGKLYGSSSLLLALGIEHVLRWRKPDRSWPKGKSRAAGHHSSTCGAAGTSTLAPFASWAC